MQDDHDGAGTETQPDTEQKIAVLAAFANGVAHDLRNPLNVIRTNLYLLRQRLPPEDPRALRLVDRIDDQVIESLRILGAIEALHASGQPSMQKLDLNRLVRTVVETTPPPPDTEILVETEPDLPLIAADPHLLEPAIRALLRNAIEAISGPSGRIVLRTTAVNGALRLAVEDTGAGIPAEVRSRVFEPVFSTRRGHSGMGLTIVARVARAHGGRVSLLPREGGGTAALLELPVRRHA